MKLQPIESAPKDGTEIFTFSFDPITKNRRGASLAHCAIINGRGVWIGLVKPTHWCPIPTLEDDAEPDVKAFCLDWAEDHTHLQILCRDAGCTEEEVEGSEYGVPGLRTLADSLVRRKDAELQAVKAELNERLHERTQAFLAREIRITKERDSLREERQKYASELQHLSDVIMGCQNTAAPFRVVMERLAETILTSEESSTDGREA